MPDAARRRLQIVYGRIAERAAAIASAYDSWPCRRGCDDCCRSLGALPAATRPEWEFLWGGYARLPPVTRAAVRTRAQAVAAQHGGPVVCPFLDPEAGACLVYEERLGACRMHGFYAARDGGRWCARIEALAAGPAGEGIVWGNHGAALGDLRAVGAAPIIDLAQWLAEQPDGP